MSTAQYSLRGRPLQVAAICYRKRGSSVELLLVNTSAGRWTFPKGRPDARLSDSEAAAREAWEEAGVRGKIHDVALDCYLDTKKTAVHNGSCELLIAAYLLRVLHSDSPGEADRNPTWFSPNEAAKRLAEGRSTKYARELARIVNVAMRHVSHRSSARPPARASQTRSNILAL